MHLLAAILVTAAAFDSTLLAQSTPPATPVMTLPEIKVEAPRHLPGSPSLPLATTVLDRHAIELSGAAHAGELLRPVVGLRVATLGGLGAFTPLSIRGSSGEQVLVMIDGRRWNAAQGGGVDLTDLPLDNVERVEVMRGGASALYGPNALGGVVNLVTRSDAAARDVDLQFEGGSLGTRLFNGRMAGGNERLSGSLSGRLMASDGDYRLTDGAGRRVRQTNAGLTSGSFDAGLTWRPTWASSIDLSASRYQASKGVPGSVEFPSSRALQHDGWSAFDADVRGLLPRGGPGWVTGPATATHAHLFAQRRTRAFDDPSFPLGPVSDRHVNRSVGASLTQVRATLGRGVLTTSAEFQHDALDSSTDGSPTRQSLGLTARQVIPLDARAGRELTPALRYDHLSGIGGMLSPRLMARWPLGGGAGAGIELRASAGRSWRPPTFDDLFLSPRASAAGNPDLRAEKAWDADLGATIGRGPWSLTTSLFASRVTDLIQWQPGAAGVWRPHNVSGARTFGVEVEARGRVDLPGRMPALNVELNYTGLDPRERSGAFNTDGRVLVYRARHQANAQLRCPLGRWELATQWRYSGSVYTTRTNSRALPGYLVGDAFVSWRATPRLTLESRLLNLNDQEYQDYRDYAVPGRQWRLALQWKPEM